MDRQGELTEAGTADSAERSGEVLSHQAKAVECAIYNLCEGETIPIYPDLESISGFE